MIHLKNPGPDPNPMPSSPQSGFVPVLSLDYGHLQAPACLPSAPQKLSGPLSEDIPSSLAVFVCSSILEKQSNKRRYWRQDHTGQHNSVKRARVCNLRLDGLPGPSLPHSVISERCFSEPQFPHWIETVISQ